MTDIQSNIKSNIIKIDEKYYSYPIYDYWILSSHNTYFPFDQYVGDANMCYYNLITSVFMGGCVEVDLYGIYEKDKIYDIKVRHAPTKKNFLKLSELLKKIVLLMKRKYQLKKEGKNLPVGPLIISFDNKDLSFDEKKHKKDDRKHSQNIFWQILEDNLLKYDNTFCNKNLSDIPTLKAKDNKYNLCDENTFFMNILKKINCNITYSWTETDNIIIDNDTTKTTKTIKIDKNEDEDDIQYVKTDKELKEANIDVVKETDSTDSTDSIDSKN